MNEKIAESFQILQTLLSRITDLDGNISRSLTMAGAFAGLISLSVKFDRWQETLFIYFDVFSMVFFLIALRARMNLKKEVVSVFYYQNIAGHTKEDFAKTFDQLTPQEYLNNLQEEIYYCSIICVDKQKWYNRGLIALAMSLFCWIAVNIWSIF